MRPHTLEPTSLIRHIHVKYILYITKLSSNVYLVRQTDIDMWNRGDYINVCHKQFKQH